MSPARITKLNGETQNIILAAYAWLFACLVTLSTAQGQEPNDGRVSLPTAGQQLSRTITFSRLLEEMSNPACLARWQDHEWVSKQVSARRLDKQHTPGFFAEKEIGNYIRVEQNESGHPELVVMEDKGPGVVVRIWFGNVEGNTNATVRIYFDGNAKPAIASQWAAFGSLYLVKGGALLMAADAGVPRARFAMDGSLFSI